MAASRIYPRNKVVRNVSYDTSGAIGIGSGRGAQTVDIGQGGVCLMSDECLEPGAVVRIRFSIEESGINVTSFAEVRWAVPEAGRYKIGLQFLV